MRDLCLAQTERLPQKCIGIFSEHGGGLPVLDGRSGELDRITDQRCCGAGRMRQIDAQPPMHDLGMGKDLI